MNPLQFTEGPWQWRSHDGGRVYLETPDRGRLTVLCFDRKGMQGATPRFAQWDRIAEGAPRERLGGIMVDGIHLPDGRLHPDARLIELAPMLAEAARRLQARGLFDQSSCADADTAFDMKAMRFVLASIAGEPEHG